MPKQPYRVAILALVLSGAAPRAETVSFDSERWEFDAAEHSLEQHLSRPSLRLKGGKAWITDASFTDGEIDFDIAFMAERGFVGAVWRMLDEANCEEFYLRPHQSGNPDANQYTPIFNGLAGWQLYHGNGYGMPVVYRFNEWMHIKIIFSGSHGEVYIDDMATPAVVIHEMKREVRPGRIGLMAGNFAPAWFSNFSFRATEPPMLKGDFKAPLPVEVGTVTAWSVSDPFDEAALDGLVVLSNERWERLRWTRLESERSGITNLARVARFGPGSNTVFARIAINADRARIARLGFGYSDRVRAYLNGRAIYGGTNEYRSRDYRYLGTIGTFDNLYLDLHEGQNELWLAVSESFGGWGVVGRFDDPSGLRVTAD